MASLLMLLRLHTYAAVVFVSFYSRTGSLTSGSLFVRRRQNSWNSAVLTLDSFCRLCDEPSKQQTPGQTIINLHSNKHTTKTLSRRQSSVVTMNCSPCYCRRRPNSRPCQTQPLGPLAAGGWPWSLFPSLHLMAPGRILADASHGHGSRFPSDIHVGLVQFSRQLWHAATSTRGCTFAYRTDTPYPKF